MACVGERAQHAHAADRFAREIIAILAVIVVRSRRLMGRPLGGALSHLVPVRALTRSATIKTLPCEPC